MSKFNDFFRKLISGPADNAQTKEPATETENSDSTAETHVLSGKSAAKIHPVNPYEQSAKDSDLLAVYADSKERLKPTPLAQDLKPINGFLSAYMAVYVLISVGTAGAIGFYGAEIILPLQSENSLFAAISATFGLLLLAGINEKGKALGLNRYFKARPVNRQTDFLLLAVITSAISIGISTAGGSLLAYNLTDQTAEIQAGQFAKTDSLNAVYDSQILDLQTTLKDLQTIDPKVYPTKAEEAFVRRTNAAMILKISPKIAELQKEKAGAFSGLQTDTDTNILTDTGKRKKYAKISAGIVLVLELLYVLFYALFWKNERAIVTEENNHLSSSETAFQMISPDTVQAFLSGLFGVNTQNISLQSVNDNRYNSTIKPKKTNPIGFRQAKTNGPVTSPLNDSVNGSSFGIDICENCGEKYSRKTWNQRFCCEQCRINKWNNTHVGNVRKGGRK